MKKTIIAATLLSCVLLVGCSSNNLESTDTINTSESESKSVPESFDPTFSNSSESFELLESSEFKESTDSSNEIQTKRESVSDEEFYDYIKTLGEIAQEDIASTGTYTLIVFEETGTLDILYKTKEGQPSALKALEVISDAPPLIEEAQKHDIYKHVYLDWADYNGKVYATWDLSRVGEKLIQDDELKWYDDEVKAEYDKIMDGDYSAVKDAAKNY